eukprot:PITA_36617
MLEEYSSIMVSDVWEVVPRPRDGSVVGSRWIYKVKYVADGSVEKYEARFVAKGYAQKEGIDYEETFAPIARYTSIRSVISFATQMGWEIHQMDVKTTILNDLIEEEVYIEQPKGFETHEKKSHKMGFVKSDADPNLYYLVVENEPPILVLYVDDLFLAGSSRLIKDCKENLATEFDMKDLGQMHYFLGLEVWQQKGGIFLGQGRYATDILKRFRMQDCRPMATPMITKWKKVDASEDKEVDPTLYWQLIGPLMYLVNTRPNICYFVNTLSQLMVEPKRVHWAATKHVLRYIRGKIEYGLMYTQGNAIMLSGLTDTDWAGSLVGRKRTTRYCFNIELGMTSCCSRKQKSVGLSSVEAEYMAASTTLCETIWLRKLLVNLIRRRMEATTILCDNQSCIKLSKNLVFHDRSKHIDIRCYFIRDCVQRGAVQLRYTPTGEQVANILTKALGRTKFVYFKEKMGMVKNLF